MESHCCVNHFMPMSDPFNQAKKITSVTLLAAFNSKIAPKGNLLGLYFRKKGVYGSTLYTTSGFLLSLYQMHDPQSVSEHHIKLERNSVTTPIYTFPLDDKYLIHA